MDTFTIGILFSISMTAFTAGIALWIWKVRR